MPDVRFVTCARLPAPDPDTPLLVAALGARGIDVAVDDWRDAGVDWTEAPLTVLRSPWDYVERLDEFLAWAEHVATVSALWNPFPLIRWNTHKAYLLELGAAGAPIVPTVVLHGSAAALAGIAGAQGWNAVVVKPAVGIGGHGAGRFAFGATPRPPGAPRCVAAEGRRARAAVRGGDRERGEYSLVCTEGVVTHAVRKTPRAGDFRIHERYGGGLEAAAPTPALAELGARVVAALPAPTLYARVDVVELEGRWHVLEVEVTEPRLYLEFAPADRDGRRPIDPPAATRLPDRCPEPPPPRCPDAITGRRPTPDRSARSPTRTPPRSKELHAARPDPRRPRRLPRSRDAVPALRGHRPAAVRGSVPGVRRRTPRHDARRGAHGRRRVRAEDERHPERGRAEGLSGRPD